MYSHNDAYADGPVDGPILVRGRDLFKSAPIVFGGPFAAGPVVGCDTIDGTPVELHSELVLYTSRPSAAAPPGWIAPVNRHPFVWYFIFGARNDWSASVAWQIDGVNFSQVVTAC